MSFFVFLFLLLSAFAFLCFSLLFSPSFFLSLLSRYYFVPDQSSSPFFLPFFFFFLFFFFFSFPDSHVSRCVSPAESNTEETLSTLRYANAAKNIQNTAVVNRSPHEVAMLRSSVKLEAMTFEYVRVAHGTKGKATNDEDVDRMLAESDVVKNDVAYILSKAMEGRDDLRATSSYSSSSSFSSSSSSSSSTTTTTTHSRRERTGSTDRTSSKQHSSQFMHKNKRKRQQNSSKEKSSSSSSSSSSAAASRISSVEEISLTEEEKANSKILIDFVKQAEKEMQEEHLGIIASLEKEEKELNQEEEVQKAELQEALKSKEEAWTEIKEILEKFPLVQAEADKLKEEVVKIEKERMSLEEQVSEAETQKDTKLVLRLKKRVGELTNLHARKTKEARQKDSEVRRMRDTQKRSTEMKSEIEHLKARQAAQSREHTKRDKMRRMEIDRSRRTVNLSQKKINNLKRDMEKIIRSETAKDTKLQRLMKEVAKLKKEKLQDAKKRRQNLQKQSVQTRRNLRRRNQHHRGSSSSNTSRSSRTVDGTVRRRQLAMEEMHQKHVAAELTIRRLEKELESMDLQKDILREQLDNAFMTGDLTDDEVGGLKARIGEVEEREKTTNDELKHMRDVSKEVSFFGFLYFVGFFLVTKFFWCSDFFSFFSSFFSSSNIQFQTQPLAGSSVGGHDTASKQMQEHQMHLQRLTQAVVEAKDEAERERLEREKFEKAQSENKRERKKLEQEKKAMRNKIQDLETRLRKKEEEDRADRSSARKRTTPQSVHRRKESVSSMEGSPLASPSALHQTKKLKSGRSGDSDADFDRISATIDLSVDEIRAGMGQEWGSKQENAEGSGVNQKIGGEMATSTAAISATTTTATAAASTSGHRLDERRDIFSTKVTSSKAPSKAATESASMRTFNVEGIASFVADITKSKRSSSSSALTLTLGSAANGRDSIRTSSGTSNNSRTSGSGKLKLKFAINKQGVEKLRSEKQLVPAASAAPAPAPASASALVSAAASAAASAAHHIRRQKNGLTDSPSKRIVTEYKLDNNCTSKEAYRYEKARKKEMEKKKKAKADMGEFCVTVFVDDFLFFCCV